MPNYPLKLAVFDLKKSCAASAPGFVCCTSDCAALGVSLLYQSVLHMAFSVQEQSVTGHKHFYSTAVSAVTVLETVLPLGMSFLVQLVLPLDQDGSVLL